MNYNAAHCESSLAPAPARLLSSTISRPPAGYSSKSTMVVRTIALGATAPSQPGQYRPPPTKAKSYSTLWGLATHPMHP
jgi:hypothetical protein